MKNNNVRNVVAIGIGTALYVVLSFIYIPLGAIPNTGLMPSLSIIAFFSAVFGPVVGAAIGLIGQLIYSLITGGVWWSWLFPMAIPAIAIGLFKGKYNVKEGGFGGGQIAVFNIAQVIGNAIAWAFLAPVLDILIYSEPANKVFLQGIGAFVGDIIVMGVLGTILLAAYSKVSGKSAGLKKED